MKPKYSQQQQRRSNVRDLLTRGVAAAKAGDKEEARFYLEWLLITDPTDDQQIEAWLWLATMSDEEEEKRHYLEEILSRNPAHARARRQLAILEGRLQREEIVDPETIASRRTADESAQSAPARQFICPRCTSRLVFMPDGNSLHCEHCGYQEQLQGDAGIEETDFIVTMATTRGHLKPVSTATFTCPSCTATYALAPGALTVTCPYCHHTYTVESAEMRQLAPPQGIIPFAVEEAEARRRIREWLRQHELRPLAPPHGAYLPAWTFDVGGSVGWQGEISASDDSNLTTRTVSGDHPVYEDDLVVPACDTLPRRLVLLLQTFDLDALRSFDDAFLAAWPAQTYEITAGDASLAARRVAFRNGREDVRRSHRALSNLRFSSAGITILSHKLILLPVWLCHYRQAEATAMLALNGQTGRLLAEHRPRSGLLSSLRRWFGAG